MMCFSVFSIGIILTMSVCLNFATVHCLRKFGHYGGFQLPWGSPSYKNQQPLSPPKISSKFTRSRNFPGSSFRNPSSLSELQQPTRRESVPGMSFPQLRSRTSKPNGRKLFPAGLESSPLEFNIPIQSSSNEDGNKTSDSTSSNKKQMSTNDNFSLEKEISEQLQQLISRPQNQKLRWNASKPLPKDQTQLSSSFRPPVRSQFPRPPTKPFPHNPSPQSRTLASNNVDSFLEILIGDNSNAVASNERTNKTSDLTSSKEKQSSTIKDSHSRKENNEHLPPSSSNTEGESVTKIQELEANASQPSSQDQKQVVPTFKSAFTNLEFPRSQPQLNTKTFPTAYEKSNSENEKFEPGAFKIPNFSNMDYLQRRQNPAPSALPLAPPLPFNRYPRRSRFQSS